MATVVKGSCVELISAIGEGAGQQRKVVSGVEWPRSGGGGGNGCKAKGKGESSYPRRGQSNSRTSSPKPNLLGTIPPDVTQLLEALQNLGVSRQVYGRSSLESLSGCMKSEGVSRSYSTTRGVGGKWLKAASHLESLLEQMTRNEKEYLAGVQRSEGHQKQVGELEAEYKEAKKLFAFASTLCSSFFSWER